jgi:hypothetical protein
LSLLFGKEETSSTMLTSAPLPGAKTTCLKKCDLDPQQRQPLLRCLLLDPGPSFNPGISSILIHINM